MIPSQKAFGLSLFFYLQLKQLCLNVQAAFQRASCQVTSLWIPDRDPPCLCLVTLTRQEISDWETVSRTNDPILQIHCCLHEDRGLSVCHPYTQTHIRVLSIPLA